MEFLAAQVAKVEVIRAGAAGHDIDGDRFGPPS
jgi:hypothetical protein